MVQGLFLSPQEANPSLPRPTQSRTFWGKKMGTSHLPTLHFCRMNLTHFLSYTGSWLSPILSLSFSATLLQLLFIQKGSPTNSQTGGE